MEKLGGHDSSDEEDAYQLEELNVNQEENKNEVEKISLDARMNTLPEPIPPQLRSNKQGAANTGPKGVLADYDMAKQNLSNKRMMERLRRDQQLDRMASGFKDLSVLGLSTPDIPNSTSDKKEAEESDQDTDENDKDNDNDDDNGEEDEAFQQYKLQRIRAIQNSLPHYGTFVRVNFSELADIIKKENEFVNLVVHLYQNNVESCGKVNIALEVLAPQFPHVHFVRIRSDEAIAKYSPAGLPTLLVYRNGSLIHSFIRITDHLSVDAPKLVKFLASNNVLRIPCEDQVAKPPQNSRTKASMVK